MNGGRVKVLVTGGAGFIGSHLCERLVAEGYHVEVLDDLSTGDLGNIEKLRGRKNFLFHYASILDRDLLDRLVGGTDLIIHLATAVGVKLIIEDPLHSIEKTWRGTEGILEAANRHKKKVLIASTSEIYGKNDRECLTEDDDRVLGTTRIRRWSYSCTMALNEFLSMAYYHEKKLPVVIARYFNICGPRQSGRFGMVFPRFISAALSGKPIEVFGDGRQVRTFLSVEDAVEATLGLLKEERAVGEVFNVGAVEKITILELAHRIKQITASTSEIIKIPYEDVFSHDFEDMRVRVPDISKIRTLTGFQPTVGIDDVIRGTVAFMKTIINSKAAL